MVTKKKRTPTPLDTAGDTKVLAVQMNQRELDRLRGVLEAHQARGSRVTVSQLVRWAVVHADFNQMPEIP